MDQAVATLVANKDEWAQATIGRKIAVIEMLRTKTGRHADEWVAGAVAAKGIAKGSPLAGEEWLSGPYSLLSWLNAAHTTLTAVANGRAPSEGAVLSVRGSGQVVARVYPFDRTEQLLLHGYSAEVWMQPDVRIDDVPAASYYQQSEPRGTVGLILGAGNISSIPPLDVVYKLFAEGSVALLKMNPVNEYLGAVFEKIFSPLIDDGFVQIVYGGADVGGYLTSHPDVDTVHVTGSADTHDAIVFGPGEDGAARKERREPILEKPISSELGGVGATIVLPGNWDDADFAFQAEHIATQKLHNSGFNCIAAQVLVLPAEWEGTERLIAEVRDVMKNVENRPAYYPGVDERHSAAHDGHENADRITEYRSLIVGVDPNDSNAHAFKTEIFGPVLATTSLPGSTAAEFLDAAVVFANETLHGTLGAQFIADPATLSGLGEHFENALADMRYGSVAVNAWSGVNYFLARAAWGAYPGHELHDIQSGSGVVHNAMFFDRPQKTVVRGPFRPFPRTVGKGEFHISPRPPWFVTNKSAHLTAERLTRYAADPKPWRLPGIFAAALRG